jgi:hypothetical protein
MAGIVRTTAYRRTTMAGKKTRTARKKSGDGLELIDLSPEEVSALSKPRDGFEEHTESLLRLYEGYRDEMKVRGLDPATVRRDLAKFYALRPVRASASKHLEMVEETSAQSSSNVWRAMLEVYAMAQAAGRTNRRIAAAIAPFAKFMQIGPRKKKTKADGT